jgi:hypothetical protein
MALTGELEQSVCRALFSGDANIDGDDPCGGGGNCQWTPGGHGPVQCAAEKIGVGVLAKARPG